MFLGLVIRVRLVDSFMRDTSLRDEIHILQVNYNINWYVKNIFDEIII